MDVKRRILLEQGGHVNSAVLFEFQYAGSPCGKPLGESRHEKYQHRFGEFNVNKTGMKKIATLIALFLLASCTPEVGSDAWCDLMKAKPKGDWTANEAADFTKHCIFRK